jgi:hypothetical protein
MYTDVEKLAVLRVSKQSDNTNVRPVDLLRAAVYRLETDEETFTGPVLITREEKPDRTLILGTGRCGVSRDMELTMLTLSEADQINKLGNSR